MRPIGSFFFSPQNSLPSKEKPRYRGVSFDLSAEGSGLSSDNETLESFPSQTVPTYPIISAKIQLSDNFFADLKKIENFYDLYLQELMPNLLDDLKLPGILHKIEMNGTQANSSEMVR